MIPPRQVVCSIAAYLLVVYCTAQRFEAINDKVPMEQAGNIFQDSYGFMWFGTVDGLIKYDGYQARRYSGDPKDSTSLSGSRIGAIHEDSHGRMLIGYGDAGADFFDRNTETAVPIDFSTVADGPMLSVYDILEDRSGKIWFGTDQGVISRYEQGDSVLHQRYRHDDTDAYSLSSDYVYYVFEDSHGNLWCGTRDGINLLDRETGRFTNHHTNPTFHTRQVMDIVEDERGTVWVSPRFTEHRLYTWDESAKVLVPHTRFVGRGWGEFRIAFGHDGNMWLSSRGRGAIRYNPQTDDVRFFSPNDGTVHGFREFFPLANLTDKYGNIWFAGGVIQKWPASNKGISVVSSESFQVTSVYADKTHIWYNSRSTYRWNRATYEKEEYLPAPYPHDLRQQDPPMLRFVRVYCVKELSPSRIVFTTIRNIFIYDKDVGVVAEYPLDYGGPFRDFEIVDNGLWICGNQGSPIYFDLETKVDSVPAFAKDILHLDAVAKSPDGTLWFGSSEYGLYALDTRTEAVRHYGNPDQEPDKLMTSTRVLDVYAPSNDSIWVGTDLGLNLLEPGTGRVTQFTSANGLPNVYISSILEDDQGHLWLGTSDGLVKFHPGRRTATRYSRSDGLINQNYMARACYKDPTGHMYFGGDQGVDFFHPAQMGINAIPPDLYVSKVSVANVPVHTGTGLENLTTLEIGYADNYLEIEMVAIHHTAPDANTYAYRIPEIQPDWIGTGTRRTIALTNLRPGHYTIEARAANADGVWSEEKTLLKLSVTPPFWQTWWFYLICALLAVAVVYSIYRYRITQIRKQERIKTEFNKIIAEIEMKALRAQMNPHFLFNSLNSVKSLISQGENEKATEYLTHFGMLIRQVLNNSMKKFVRLQEDLEALRLYLELEKMRFQNFEYTIHVDPDVNADFVEIPALLLQPYVENAIWHGLMHKLEGDRKLWIEISLNGDVIKMSVTDNGIGREKALRLQTRSSSKKDSLGMKLSGDRLKLLHEIYGKEARMEVEDLKDPSGTRVTVYLPNPD